ncbi:hypothetical protein DFH28DRAFT_948685, partial [Melampsora americana]
MRYYLYVLNVLTLFSYPISYGHWGYCDLYQPLNSHFQSISALDLSVPKQDLETQKKDLGILLSLSKKYMKAPTGLYIPLRNIESRTSRRFQCVTWIKSFSKTALDPGYEVEWAVSRAYKERVWVLCVLKHLQGYLSPGHFQLLMGEKMTWPMRSAALQLHWTKETDLLHTTKILWTHEKESDLAQIDPCMREAIFRLETINWIRSQSDNKDQLNLPPFLVEVYDNFLQKSCPTQEQELENLMVKSLDISRDENASKKEKILAFKVLFEAASISSKARKIIEDTKSHDHVFKQRYEEGNLIREIDYFIKNTSGTLVYCLEPFLHMNTADIHHVQYIVEQIYQPHKQLSLKSRKHSPQEESIIKLVYRISSHIEGAQSYLEETLEWNDHSQTWELKCDPPEENSSTNEKCAICMRNVYDDGKSVDLGHGSHHTFHKICLTDLHNHREPEEPLRCPLCRIEFELWRPDFKQEKSTDD